MSKVMPAAINCMKLIGNSTAVSRATLGENRSNCSQLRVHYNPLEAVLVLNESLVCGCSRINTSQDLAAPNSINYSFRIAPVIL